MDNIDINADFCDACCDGNLGKVQYFLTSPDIEEHANIHARNYYGFQMACGNGHLEVVKYLLTSKDLKEHADMHADNDLGFRWACEDGHIEVVKYLLTSPDLKEPANAHAKNDYGLIWACANDRSSVVEFLINETSKYTIDNIKAIVLEEQGKIKKEDLIEMIKTRDLKNQLLNEVSLKNKSEKTRSII